MSLFIVLEGPDGSGSTKHAEILYQRFVSENIPVLKTGQPSTGKIGVMTRELLFQKPLPPPTAFQLLFCADRAEHCEKVITPALALHTHVVCERHSLSTIIYGTAAGVDRDWLTAVNSAFIKPTLTIILLPPFEVCQKRILERSNPDEHEKKVDFQRKIYDLYAKIHEPNTVFVDTSGTVEESAEMIWQAVLPLLT